MSRGQSVAVDDVDDDDDSNVHFRTPATHTFILGSSSKFRRAVLTEMLSEAESKDSGNGKGSSDQQPFWILSPDIDEYAVTCGTLDSQQQPCAVWSAPSEQTLILFFYFSCICILRVFVNKIAGVGERGKSDPAKLTLAIAHAKMDAILQTIKEAGASGAAIPFRPGHLPAAAAAADAASSSGSSSSSSQQLQQQVRQPSPPYLIVTSDQVAFVRKPAAASEDASSFSSSLSTSTAPAAASSAAASSTSSNSSSLSSPSSSSPSSSSDSSSAPAPAPALAAFEFEIREKPKSPEMCRAWCRGYCSQPAEVRAGVCTCAFSLSLSRKHAPSLRACVPDC